MPPVPAVRGSRVVGALEKAGFVVARINGRPAHWRAARGDHRFVVYAAGTLSRSRTARDE